MHYNDNDISTALRNDNENNKQTIRAINVQEFNMYMRYYVFNNGLTAANVYSIEVLRHNVKVLISLSYTSTTGTHRTHS